MKEGTSALPRLLERCSAVALMGVAGFAIALILAITSGTSGAAIAVMLVSSVAILASMVVATFVLGATGAVDAPLTDIDSTGA